MVIKKLVQLNFKKMLVYHHSTDSHLIVANLKYFIKLKSVNFCFRVCETLPIYETLPKENDHFKVV